MSHGADNFYTSDKVTVQKVNFKNQYQMNVSGNLFTPKNLDASTKSQRLLLATRWALSKSKALICMPRNWQNKAS